MGVASRVTLYALDDLEAVSTAETGEEVLPIESPAAYRARLVESV